MKQDQAFFERQKLSHDLRHAARDLFSFLDIQTDVTAPPELIDPHSHTADFDPLPETSAISVADFRQQFQNPGIPLVFRGAARDWGCCQNWCVEYIRECHGSDRLGPLFTLEKILNSPTDNYVRFYNLFQRHPERLAEIGRAHV